MFQFLIGNLQTRLAKVVEYTDKSFNSLQVIYKRQNQRKNLKKKPRFNSLQVIYKRTILFDEAWLDFLFQFLIGNLQTGEAGPEAVVPLKFQFLIGNLQTRLFTESTPGFACFNSLQVIYKPICQSYFQAIMKCFNSLQVIYKRGFVPMESSKFNVSIPYR